MVYPVIPGGGRVLGVPWYRLLTFVKAEAFEEVGSCMFLRWSPEPQGEFSGAAAFLDSPTQEPVAQGEEGERRAPVFVNT